MLFGFESAVQKTGLWDITPRRQPQQGYNSKGEWNFTCVDQVLKMPECKALSVCGLVVVSMMCLHSVQCSQRVLADVCTGTSTLPISFHPTL